MVAHDILGSTKVVTHYTARSYKQNKEAYPGEDSFPGLDIYITSLSTKHSHHNDKRCVKTAAYGSDKPHRYVIVLFTSIFIINKLSMTCN